jgi:hypothetical protein
MNRICYSFHVKLTPELNAWKPPGSGSFPRKSNFQLFQLHNNFPFDLIRQNLAERNAELSLKKFRRPRQENGAGQRIQGI